MFIWLALLRDMGSLKDSNKGPSNSASTLNNEPTQLDEVGPSTKPSKPKSKNKGK